MPDLAGHLAYLDAEFAALEAAPLSSRQAMLVVCLIDAWVDRLYAATVTDGDLLEFRSALAERSPALRLVFALCARREGGPLLVTEAVDVPLAEYGGLSVEDFMVSLYNNHTVQRVRIALPDGKRADALTLLGDAIAAVRRLLP